MKAGETMTQAEAWNFFWSEIRPKIWDGLDAKEKNKLTNANRSAQGKTPWPLGARRMQDVFDRYAPGRFRVEVEVKVIFVK